MDQLRERKWGSSGSANPRRLPSALKKTVDPEQRMVRPPSAAVRPPSTRPDSRRSRPSSRIEQRPDSRLESSRSLPRQDITRPKSGVRPLSGKVFMRRTTDHGWVAKAYNVNGDTALDGANSQPELILFDDFSDNESLDSFFDDDFDVQTSEEKLGNLLSCNTLGVESKGNKQDWVSGKLGIPEFHCPRCRDHWYGLTDVPCDEELARLIREGLWKTGKEGGTRAGSSRHGRGRNKSNRERDKDYKSHSDTTLSANSSTTRLERGSRQREGRGPWGKSTGEDADKKKVKKKITFKLDNEIEGSSVENGSSSQLDNYGGYKRAQGSKKFGDGISNEAGRKIEALNGGSEANFGLRAPNDDSSSTTGGYGNGAADGAHHSKRTGGKTTDNDSSGYSNGLGHSSDGDSNSRRTKAGYSNSSDNHSGFDSGSATGTGRGGGQFSGDSKHLAAGKSSAGGNAYDNLNNTGLSNGETYGNRSHLGAETTISNGHNDSTLNGASTDPSSINANGNSYNKASSKGPGSQGTGSSSQVKLSGSRRGSLSTEDHGKNVRKAGGYMRAVSPNSSEWGDPTHARPFISSTATSRTVSRCGSAVNLGRDFDDEKEGLTLPPIVPAINSKKPLLDLSDLMGGFEFTRAWTFSYHNNC